MVCLDYISVGVGPSRLQWDKTSQYPSKVGAWVRGMLGRAYLCLFDGGYKLLRGERRPDLNGHDLRCDAVLMPSIASGSRVQWQHLRMT